MIPKFLNEIDWELLKDQKMSLLYAISELEENSMHACENGHPDYAEELSVAAYNLEGIVNLLDYIQDFAEKNMDIPEKVLFNLTDEDE